MSPHTNELSLGLLSAMGLNPFVAHNSASRAQMYGSHLGQALAVADSTPRRIMTGFEREYAKYTFSIKMPVNARIIRVIQRYQETHGAGSIRDNPQTVVIYEDEDTRTIGYIDLVRYHCIHQHFGFRYVYKPGVNLYKGAFIPKGTIIADSPLVTENGDYKLGTEMNVAFMSVPAVIEDGVVISESAARRLTTKAYGTRVANWGKRYYPLNLYGDGENYKPFPDIGERVREDGLLFALRAHDDLLSVVEKTTEALQTPDYIYDKLIYAEPGAKIVDIKVHYGHSGKSTTPVGMEHQAEKYANSATKFYETLLGEYHRWKSERREALVIAPPLQRLLVEALADSGKAQDQRVVRTHRMVPLDDYRVEIVFEHDLVPTIGFKLTGCHGDKGVICDILPDDHMPIDAAGNRAELIMFGNSTVNRMNEGRFYEHYINACARELTESLRQRFGLDKKAPVANDIRKSLTNTAEIQKAYETLLDFYGLVSPLFREAFNDKGYKENPKQHVESVLRDGIYIWFPTDNPKLSSDIIEDLRRHYPPVHGPVTYRGKSGNVVVTKDPVLIGSMYILLLDKTGGNWAGVASAKLQHFGTPSKLTNSDKHSSPARLQAIRITGEAEVRLFAATMGGEATAEILDQSNNPAAHKQIVNNILHADRPTNMASVINRVDIPRGNGRPVVFIRHLLECGGIHLKRNGDNK